MTVPGSRSGLTTPSGPLPGQRGPACSSAESSEPGCRVRPWPTGRGRCTGCGETFTGDETRCGSCRATERTCTGCGGTFRGTNRRCSTCQRTERTCTGCGAMFTGKLRRCHTCRATKRTCADCGGTFRGAENRCSACRVAERTCTGCGGTFRGKGYRCDTCRITERTCADCGGVFKGRHRRCLACRARFTPRCAHPARASTAGPRRRSLTTSARSPGAAGNTNPTSCPRAGRATAASTIAC